MGSPERPRVAPASGERPALVSVVIPVRNGGDLLEEQLAALAAQDYDGAWEVVVADNGSTDGTQARVEAWVERFPVPLRVIDASAQVGVAMARNAGSAVADGDFHVYCDADDVADPGWVRGIAETARHAHLVAGWLEYERLNEHPVVEWRDPMGRDEPPKTMGWMPYAIGAAFGIWKEVFDELGGFKPEFATFGDDVELSWRAQFAGHRLALARDAVMHYRFRTDLKSFGRQYRGYGRAEPHLYVAFRDRGLPRRKLGMALYGYAWLVKHLPDLRDPVRRGIWVREASFTLGRLRGAIETRTLYV